MSRQGTASDGAGTVVLVVEDEGLIRMMLAIELEDAGFVVIEATNADVAMAKITDRPDIAVVVTDVRMPGSVDGLGFAAWMREHAPSVPIVITAGFAELPDIAAINPAIARIVAKPYRPQEVATWVREVSSRAVTPPNWEDAGAGLRPAGHVPDASRREAVLPDPHRDDNALLPPLAVDRSADLRQAADDELAAEPTRTIGR